MNQNPFNGFLQEYENLRAKSVEDLEKRKKEVFNKIPRIKEIQDELGAMGISITKAILSNPSSQNALVEDLHQKNIDLQMEMGELLAENNYPLDYLSIKYTCKTCQDTGFVDNKKCACLKQKIIKHSYKLSNLESLLSIQNFDTFNFDYYKDSAEKGHNTSSKKNIQNIYKTCLGFTKNFGTSFENMLFTGPPGLGKTFLSSCIAKELLDKGYCVFYNTAYNLFDILENHQFNRMNEFDKLSLDLIFSSDLLIIDDLGTEFINSYTSSEFFNVLNSRILSKKPTIISTNLDLDDLVNTYSERVVSRVMENYKILTFFGEDIRVKKNIL